MHGGDEMCRQRRYNLSLATNCAGATKCAVTHVVCHEYKKRGSKMKDNQEKDKLLIQA